MSNMSEVPTYDSGVLRPAHFIHTKALPDRFRVVLYWNSLVWECRRSSRYREPVPVDYGSPFSRVWSLEPLQDTRQTFELLMDSDYVLSEIEIFGQSVWSETVLTFERRYPCEATDDREMWEKLDDVAMRIVYPELFQ